MKSVFFRLALLLWLGLSFGSISAQDTLSRSAWIEKVYTLIYADWELIEEEEKWVKESLNTTCDCTLMEPKEKAMECGEAFMKAEDLPLTEEAMNSMTPEQERKFMLLSPLFNLLGKCPE